MSQIKLPDQISVFHAEILALRKAVQIVAARPRADYVVLTDSLSSLEFLSNIEITSYTPAVWFEIKKLVMAIEEKGSNIMFLWVPSHQNIELNEAVDVAAKEACQSGGVDYYRFTCLDIVYPTRTRSINVWQSAWNVGTKGRFCHSIIPTVSTQAWFKDLGFSRREIVLLSKLISNHSRLPSHLKRNNIVEDDTCPCGEAPASPEHLLFDCNIYGNWRRIVWTEIVSEGAFPDLQLILCSRNIKLLKTIANFFINCNIDM